jgi:hypothetical protein
MLYPVGEAMDSGSVEAPTAQSTWSGPLRVGLMSGAGGRAHGGSAILIRLSYCHHTEHPLIRAVRYLSPPC